MTGCIFNGNNEWLSWFFCVLCDIYWLYEVNFKKASNKELLFDISHSPSSIGLSTQYFRPYPHFFGVGYHKDALFKLSQFMVYSEGDDVTDCDGAVAA